MDLRTGRRTDGGARVRPPPRRSPFGARRPDDVRAPAAIVRVEGLDGPEARAVGRDGSIELLATGPRIWLAVSDRGPDEVEAAVAAAAGRAAACTDLTHARVVLRVAGEDARARLARGCPMDLGAVAPGAAVATMLGPFEVVIRRDRGRNGGSDRGGADAFDVFVSRSLARSARQWLRGIDPPAEPSGDSPPGSPA